MLSIIVILKPRRPSVVATCARDTINSEEAALSDAGPVKEHFFEIVSQLLPIQGTELLAENPGLWPTYFFDF